MATNALPVGGSEQSYLVTVVVDGTPCGVFDTFEGGDTAAPSLQHRNGGQRNMTSYPTLPKYAALTVSRVMEFTRDWELERALKQKAGIVTASVTIQPLDADGNVYGAPQVASGMFLGTKGIKGDSDSEALSTYSLDFSVDSWA